MYARDIIIMIVLFGLVITLGGIVVTDMANTYDVENMSSPAFTSNYNTLNTISDSVSSMTNATSGGQGLVNVGSFTTIVSGTWTVFKLIFGSVGIVRDTFVNFASEYIPYQIANLVSIAMIAVLSTIIVFIIIGAVLKSRL